MVETTAVMFLRICIFAMEAEGTEQALTRRHGDTESLPGRSPACGRRVDSRGGVESHAALSRAAACDSTPPRESAARSAARPGKLFDRSVPPCLRVDPVPCSP